MKLIHINDFKESFHQFVADSFNLITKEEIEKNLQFYLRQSQNMGQLESRISEKIEPARHLEVTVKPYSETYMMEKFNSHNHFIVHVNSLFMLQQFVTKFGYKLYESSDKYRYLFLIYLMFISLTFSKYSPKYASLVYVSNIEGVFAIAEQYNKKEQFQAAYQKLYDQLPIQAMLNNNEEFIDEGDEIKSTLKGIHQYIEENKHNIFLDQAGFRLKNKQNEELVKNINNISSDFHKLLIQGDLEEWTTHDEHVTYQVFINIIYIASHMLGYSFKEKNFCCYAVCEAIMQQYNTSWQKIMRERGFAL